MSGIRRIQSQGTESRHGANSGSDGPTSSNSRHSSTRRNGCVPHVSRRRRTTVDYHEETPRMSMPSSRRASVDLHTRRPSSSGRPFRAEKLDSKSKTPPRSGSTSRPASRSRPLESKPLERGSSSGMRHAVRKDSSSDKQADHNVARVLAQISSLKRQASKGSEITYGTDSTGKLSTDSSASPPSSVEMTRSSPKGPRLPSSVIEFTTNAAINAPRKSSRVVPPPPMRRVSLDSIDSFTPLPLVERKTIIKRSTGVSAGALSGLNQSLNSLVYCGDEAKHVLPRRPKFIPPVENEHKKESNFKSTKPKPLSVFQEIKDAESVPLGSNKASQTNDKKICHAKVPPPPPPLSRRQTSEESADKDNATLPAVVQNSASKLHPPPPPPRKNANTNLPLKSSLRTTRRSLQQSEPDLHGLGQSQGSLNNSGSFDGDMNQNSSSQPSNIRVNSLHQSMMSLNQSDKELDLSKSEPNGLDRGLDLSKSDRSGKSSDGAKKSQRKLTSFFARRASIGATTPVPVVVRPSSASPPPPRLEGKVLATEPNATSLPSSTPKSKLINQDRRHASHVVNMPYTDPTYGDSGLYTGEIDAFKRPHGKGKMKYENGIFYEGKWENGMQDTKAAVNRQRILSGFSSWKGQPKNGGTTKRCTVYGMDWIDFRGMAGKYTGDVNEDNIPDGKGIMKYDFGLIAEGEWIKGVLNIGSSEGQIAGGANIVPGGTGVPGGVRGAVVGGQIPGNGVPGGMSVVGGPGMSVVSGLGMMSISGNGGMGGGMPIMHHMMNNPYSNMGGGMMPQMQMGQYCLPYAYDPSMMMMHQ